MPGLTPKTHSLEELKALPSQTDWERVRREAREGIEPADDEDSPDATALMHEAIATRRAGRPAGNVNKEQVAIRFDRDVLAAFQAEGPGWQTRMNAALREWLETHREVGAS